MQQNQQQKQQQQQVPSDQVYRGVRTTDGSQTASNREGQSYHIQFKSLGSIEEESPRWINPPQPLQQEDSTSSRGLHVGPSGSEIMAQLLGHCQSEQSSSNQNDFPHGSKTQDEDDQRQQERIHCMYDRHVQSQPALLTNDKQYRQNSVESSGDGNRRSQVREQQVLTQRQQDQPYGALMMAPQNQPYIQSSTQRQGPGGFTSPSYRIGDSQVHLFSGRSSKSSIFETFVDRLYTREKATRVQEELNQIEQMLLSQVAKELPDIHDQLEATLRQSCDGGQNKSHFAALDATLSQAQNLRASFAKFQNTRNELHSFGQMVEGIKMDVDEAIGPKVLTETQSTNSMPGLQLAKESGSSSINNIKMPQHAASGDHLHSQSSNENFLVQIMRQQEQEIAQCNKLVDKLKNECADLELTVVDQRSEIQNLCNRLKVQISTSDQSATSQSFNSREMDSLVQRLKEELGRSQDEERQAKSHLNESAQVIQNLKTQISSLKHKLVLSDGAANNIHSAEMQAQLKELADVRTHNLETQRRYQEMASQVQIKEKELLEMEEKSKQMLIAAQQDAHDCIKYFKGLAMQQQVGNLTARSQSPIQNRRHQQMQAETVKAAFPTSLGPVNASGRAEKNKKTFKGSSKQYVVNGVTLNVKSRQSLDKRREIQKQRAQTLSPLPQTSREQQQPYNSFNRRTIEDSTMSDRSATNQKWAKSAAAIREPNTTATTYQFECAIGQLVTAFQEIASTKTQMNQIMGSVNEQYVSQLQKFSVLAYDYLERIGNVSQREVLMREEFTKQSYLVEQLKTVTVQQNEHLQAQSALISEQQNQISLQKLTKESESCEHVSQTRDLGKIIKSEFPQLRDALTASHVALLQNKKQKGSSQKEFASLTEAHDLAKKKVHILEEELEKSLQTGQMLEDTIQANRKKFTQLVDLIKDIWLEEVQSSAGGATQSLSVINRGNTVKSLVAPETVSDLTQTIQTVVPEVPMPVSWLSDITDHIKTLREMNDLQTEDVFQIVGLLHSKGENKDSAASAASGDKLCESNTTDEEAMEEKVTHSGLSQAFGRGGHQQERNFHGGYDGGQDSRYNPYNDETGEQTETERGLDHYNELALNGGPTIHEDDEYDEDNKYINTTSHETSKQKGNFKFNSQSQDKKEMSFSQRLEDSQEVSFIHQRRNMGMQEERKRGKSQTHTGRRLTNPQVINNAAGHRDRSQPSRNIERNLEWPDDNLINKTQRVVETQRIEKHRRSLNITSNRWKEALFSDNDRNATGRQRNTIVHTNMAQQQQNPYRASINMTEMQETTTPMMVGDSCKRNELYSMLREEVILSLKQTEVHKNTIVGMKKQLKHKFVEIGSQNQAYQILHEEKESLVDINKNLEGEIKDLEGQIDELQGVVHDRELSMDNLKLQIEDFEKELMGLQDQMTHVMKLNQEIGMASEHWEHSFVTLQDQSAKEQAKLKSDFQKKISRKSEKLQLIKRKLQEREGNIQGLQQELGMMTSKCIEQETRRQTAISTEVQTDPAMELLEQHKAMLEKKLEQVKRDVSAVLDQVEKEQQQNNSLQKKLTEQKQVNQSVVGELDHCKSKLCDASRETEQLQHKLVGRLDEIKQISEAMGQDQVNFREQMEDAEKINYDLQQQVEEVTRAAEDLQEQMTSNYQTNDNLAHNAQIQEQKINQLEDQLVYYQNQLKQKKMTIQRLETRLTGSVNGQERKATSKRETRSVSVPRMYSKNSTGAIQGNNPFTSQLNTDYSQIVKDGRNSQQSSVSKQSSSLIGGGVVEDAEKVPHRFNIANDDINNSIHTSQSIFDETPLLSPSPMKDSATFQQHHQQLQQNTSNYFKKPPRNQRTTKGGQNSSSHTSPMLANAKQHGGSSVMGASQITACCCGSAGCLNSTSQLKGIKQSSEFKDSQQQPSTKRTRQQASSKMTAIDDLQSSYANFKIKHDVGRESKKKLKKVLHLTEVLVRHYLSEAQLRMDSFNKQFGTTRDQRGNGGEAMRSSESTLTNLRRQVTNWSAENSSNLGKPVSEVEAREAQEFFAKRNPKVLSCMLAILDHVGLHGAAGVSEFASQDQATTKDPPQIISHRDSEGQIETDYSQNQEVSNEKPNRVYGTVPNDTGDAVNLLIQEHDYAGSNTNDRNLQYNLNLNSERTQQFTMKSPTSSCRNCTATFNQTQSMTNDLLSHCKVLFQKFLQTGRSLAGICYGGCLFMGDQLKPLQRNHVDFALQFLSKDSSEFEGTNGQSLDELWGVVDGLLTCLSQIISQTCQQQLRGDNKQTQQAFDSIVQKSVELSIDQNHMISRMEKASFDGQSVGKSIDFPGPSQNINGSSSISQVNVKLADLEVRMKQKFKNIKQLESLLDNILGKNRDQAALLPQIINDMGSLQKIFMNIRRVVSKLKIELHQDYLFLGQVNLHFQTQRDHNSSMQTTFDVPNMQTQNSQPSTQGAGMGFYPSNLHNRNMTAQASMPTVSGGRMQIGSGIVSNSGAEPITAREQPNNSTIAPYQDSQPYYSPHPQTVSGLNLRSQVSIGKQSTLSNVTSPVLIANMSSARFSNGSHAQSNTARGGPQHNPNVDKIVEELQSLTFEYSNGGTTVNRTMTQGGISATYSNATPYQQQHQY